jgi:hypothetical protein
LATAAIKHDLPKGVGGIKSEEKIYKEGIYRVERAKKSAHSRAKILFFPQKRRLIKKPLSKKPT